MTRKIRWGILGLGNIANTFATALKSMRTETELYAVASRSKSKAEAFGNKFQVSPENCYGSYEDLVNDPKVDVIYIALPHNFHKNAAILCMKAGKAVLCEKPVAPSYEDTYEMVDFARKNHVFFMEAMWTRFLPSMKKTKQLIKDGAIGPVRLIKADFSFGVSVDPKGRLFDPALAGGAHLDVGIYTVSFATFLTEKVPKIISSAAYIGETGVDYTNGSIFIYDDGSEAIVNSSIVANSIQDAIIIGEKGRIVLPDFWKCEEIHISNDQGDSVISYPFEFNGYEHEAREVIQCLNQGLTESTYLPLDETLRVMKIMDEIKSKW